MQRAYDQILCDTALQKLPVVFLIDRAGHVGADGETHHGVFDLSYLGHIPNMTILTPADGEELTAMMEYALNRKDGPVAIRYPRGSVPEDLSTTKGLRGLSLVSCEATTQGLSPCPAAKENTRLIYKAGKSRIVYEPTSAPGTDSEAEIWAAGPLCTEAISAAAQMTEQGHPVRVRSVMSVKPLDTESLSETGQRGTPIITVEDNVISGGFGESVSAFLESGGYASPVKTLAWPDEFLSHGSTSIFLRDYGLDAEGIRLAAEGLLRGAE
jgi:1-deoxy-D-xylulose-5-phosphate synthase